MSRQVLTREYASHPNCLNALRLIFATLVIVSHAPVLVRSGAGPMLADMDLGNWAVVGFFAISGWLITGSRLTMDLAPYLWRRGLRIFPAFWAALLLTAFVFAPIAWLHQGQPFDVSSSVGYVVRNASLWTFQPGIEGTLTEAAELHWNLSLWTLSWEMLCYLGIGLLLTFRWVRQRPWTLLVLLVLASGANALVRTDLLSLPGAAGAGLRPGTFFLAGAVLRVYGDRLPANRGLAALSVGIVALLWPLGLVGSFGALPLAYLCLYAGLRLPLSRIGSRNDISYGIYIYGFPVGQLILMLGGGAPPMPVFVLLTIAIVVPLAWASWLVVEQVAMRWKRLVPARRPVTPTAVGHAAAAG